MFFRSVSFRFLFIFLKNNVIWYDFEALERTLTCNARRPQPLKSKEGDETAGKFGSSDENSFQEPDPDPKQWREGVPIVSHDEPENENIMSPLLKFSSI